MTAIQAELSELRASILSDTGQFPEREDRYDHGA
jgi:hypothetical protein